MRPIFLLTKQLHLLNNVKNARCILSIAPIRHRQINITGNKRFFKVMESSMEITKSALEEIFKFQTTNVSSWIIEGKVKTICMLYRRLEQTEKFAFLETLAKDFSVDHHLIAKATNSLNEIFSQIEKYGETDENILRRGKLEQNQSSALTPRYFWLFMHIGRLEYGVKFLVDLRVDLLVLMGDKKKHELQQLNKTLQFLLAMWFSLGFLQLERITWQSSCDMLQKISEYEAVHPIRSWADLKRRVGLYRRCFVYTHHSMPGEPLVVLHTALTDEICSSLAGIVSSRSRMTDSDNPCLISGDSEDSSKVKAAVFYSISSTQKGLQGIELGNYLIKRVVRELQQEFPNIRQFSSLSPIPGFKVWLLDKIKETQKGETGYLTSEEIQAISQYFNSNEYWTDFRRLLINNNWLDDKKLLTILETPLMRLCARYLYLEKRRGYALDSVENFHLRNGAVLWRLNWAADLSPRGLTNSCGIMVNYRYFLEDTEHNSTAYLEKKTIQVSQNVKKLVNTAQALMVLSKI